jgi:hypothetical protein
MRLCDCEISAPAIPIPQESLSSPFIPPRGLGKAPQLLETQVAEALISMKYPMDHYSSDSDEVDLSPQSPMVLDSLADLPGLSFLSPSTSFSAIPEIC